MKFQKTLLGSLAALLVLIQAVFVYVSPVFGADGIPIPIESSTVRQSFQFDARSLIPRPHEVNLGGTFNGWSKTETPMVDNGGIYTIALDLEPGLYHYKFLVDGEQWFIDPAANKALEDEDDHNNSGVVVTSDASHLSPAQPDRIDPKGLAHNSASEADCNVASDSLLRLRIRTADEGVQSVTAWYRTPENPHWVQAPLEAVDHSPGFERYGAVLRVSGTRADYFFELTHGRGKAYMAGAMLYDTREAAENHPFSREMRPVFETPEWAKHAVWYQIFPERFRNGDPSNDPPGTQRWQSNWYSALRGESAGSGNSYPRNIWDRRYGGDLQGVREELPYLRQLGVTAIYLNPIFAADSAHKYDTRDYRHVDDYFGVKDSAKQLIGETDDPATWKWSASDRVLLDLIQEAHRQGFKVILDGVFNHVGKSNPLFQDVLRNGKKSSHAGWFDIIDWGAGGQAGEPGGLQYGSWDGRNGEMPVIKKDAINGIADGPRQYILAIARRWLAPDGDPARGVDGFRIDAAPFVPHPFWIEFRRVVKSIKPEAYITGEVWPWAQAWLGGDQFDAVTNYQFATAGQEFFADKKKAISPSQFDERLNRLFYNYPLQVVFAQMNLFDSHDTDRVASWFLNPDRGIGRPERLPGNGPAYDRGKPGPVEWQRLRQALDFQMSFVGAPIVYYGDEAGMWGPTDPSDRMPMWWKDLEPFDNPEFKFDQNQFECYQRAIAVRRQLPELQDGVFRRVAVDDLAGTYAFARDDGQQCAYIVLNRSGQARRISISVNSGAEGAPYVNWLDPMQTELVPANLDQPQSRPMLRTRSSPDIYRVQESALSIVLPAYGTAILRPVK